MLFTVEDMMKNAFVLTDGDATYGRFCRRMRDAGFDRMPLSYNADIPKCLIGTRKWGIASMAHYSIVRMAKTLGLDFVTVFEYDAYPMNGCRSALSCLFADGIPDDADIITLGNIHWIRDYTNRNSGKSCLVGIGGDSRFGRIRPPLWGSHAVIYLKRGYDTYIENYLSIPEGDACNCDHFERLSPDTYAAYRSFFIQVKDKLCWDDSYTDQEWLSDFPDISDDNNKTTKSRTRAEE